MFPRTTDLIILEKRGNLKLSDTLGWKFDENFRDGKWPTLFSERWKVADIFFNILESCRQISSEET